MKRKYLILFSLSGFLVTLDQFTKQLAWRYLSFEKSIDLLGGFLSLSLVRNDGFAFGMLQRAPASLKDVFFIAVPVFAMILIVLIFIKLRDDQMLTSVALTSILGGAVGNLIDRLQAGYVLDFINIRLGLLLKLPPLNFADLAILFGVALMFISTLKHRTDGETSEA